MRRTITTFSALLALAFTACVNPSPEVPEIDPTQNPSTQEVIKKTDAPTKTDTLSTPDKVKTADSAKKIVDSIVLNTLKVEPTPGLVDAKDFRQRGALSNAYTMRGEGGEMGMAVGGSGASDGLRPAMAEAPRMIAPPKPSERASEYKAPTEMTKAPAKKGDAPSKTSTKGLIDEGDGFGHGDQAAGLIVGYNEGRIAHIR